MDDRLTFLHAGTFGDTIYGMSAVKLLGGGDVYIQMNGINAVAWNAFGLINAGEHAGRYTQKDLDFLFPLLEKQSYIRNVKVWRNEPVVHDLSKHYKFTTGPRGWQGNQTECYAMVCGLDINYFKKELLLDPWIDSVEPIRIPGRPIVINRTHRYLQGCEYVGPQWKKWVSEGLSDLAVFVGTEKECDEFNRTFNSKVPHHPVTDMLEMARIIQGCEQFMGNQSVALSLAIGLGKTFWCETRKDWDAFRSPHGWGDVWFPRINGHYF
jgi:hypothetical protein